MSRVNRTMILGVGATQAPFLEFDTRAKRWRVWLAFSADVNSGTFLEMYPSGLCERVTQKDGVVQTITIITGPVGDEHENQDV